MYASHCVRSDWVFFTLDLCRLVLCGAGVAHDTAVLNELVVLWKRAIYIVAFLLGKRFSLSGFSSEQMVLTVKALLFVQQHCNFKWHIAG